MEIVLHKILLGLWLKVTFTLSSRGGGHVGGEFRALVSRNLGEMRCSVLEQELGF